MEKLFENCFPRQYFDLFYISDSFSESISSIENQNLANLENVAKMSKNYNFFKNGFLQNQSNMLYLSIFTLSWRCKIKFHGDRPSRKSIWTNLDPKSIFLYIFVYLLIPRRSEY